MINTSVAEFYVDPKKGPAYHVDPAIVYPMTLEHVKDRIANEQRPPEVLAGLYEKAKEVNPKAWEYTTKHVRFCPEDLVDGRAILLEVARLWFTEVLHQAHGGGGMGVHILNRPDFKLYADKHEGDKKERTILRALGLRIVR